MSFQLVFTQNLRAQATTRMNDLNENRHTSKKRYGGVNVGDKMKSTKNHKKEDGTFHAKKIKHDPQAESARAVFGLKDNHTQNSR